MRTRLSIAAACGVLSLTAFAMKSPAQEVPSAVPGAPIEVGEIRINQTLLGESSDLEWTELGRHRPILRVVPAPHDREFYGESYDFGPWSGTAYAGLTDLPVGYWVYVYPDWYILGEEVPQTITEPVAPGSDAWPKWHPMQATGAPNTLHYGDYGTAWASLSPDDQPEWLDLTYEQGVVATAILVFENCNPGALQSVRVWNDYGGESEVWQAAVPPPPAYGPVNDEYVDPYNLRGGDDIVIAEIEKSPTTVQARVIPLPAGGTAVRRVRLELNSPAVAGWNEIDAVGLLASDGQIRWATGAEASTSFADWNQSTVAPIDDPSSVVVYDSNSWSPSQATGAPNTLEAGDYVTAWAPLSQDEQAEWLELTYELPIAAAAVLVHESYNPGALRKVTGWTADGGEETTIWEGVDPTSPQSASGVSIIPVPAGVGQLVRVRLHLDSPAVSGWNEIDAVGLLDAAGQTHWAVGATASSSYAERYTERRDVYYLEVQELRTEDASGPAPATIIIRSEEELPR